MKTAFFSIMLTVSIGIMCFAASRSMHYKIRVIKSNKVVNEVSIHSQELVDKTVNSLSAKFPHADRIEIESSEQSVLM